MRALTVEKRKAIQLRQKGRSLTDICHELQLSKGTVYSWIRNIDVAIKRSKRSRERLLIGTKVMQENCRLRRESAYKEAYKKAPRMMKDADFRDFVVAYMCEGANRNRQVVDFTNTDASLHKLFLRNVHWITSKKPVFVLIGHNCDSKMTSFWASELGIQKKSIRSYEKGGNVSPNRHRNGTFKICIHDTIAKSRLYAYMDFLRESWHQKGL